MIKMNNKLNFLLGCIALFSITLQSCKDDDTIPVTNDDTYAVPTSYAEFDNVSYGGQTQRLNQLLEMKNYFKSSLSAETALEEEKLLAMFSNDASKAGWAGTYEDSKQIKSKTFEPVQLEFENVLKSMVLASNSGETHSQGIAGISTSKDNAKKYWLNANGVDEAQVFEKGLMGAFIAYQINEVYTGESKMNVDNEEVTPGKGTKMEHHWDEAFGYLGVPLDYPSSTDNLLFWGSYANKRNELLACNQELMNAFIAGRAAITNRNLANRDIAIANVRAAMEKLAAANAIHYINETLEKMDDICIKGHALAEAYGFTYALKFNTNKTITSSDLSEVLVNLGASETLADLDFYAIDLDGLNNAKNKLSSTYGLDDIKDLL
jgi:hypothetical protein